MLKIYPDKGYAFEDGEPMVYADSYFDRYSRMAETPIGKALNNFRSSLVSKYCDSIIDIGIGDGAFLKKFPGRGLGYDVCEKAENWLKSQNRWADPYESFPDVEAISFWDSLEHIKDPTLILDKIPHDAFVFFSLPIFSDITKITESKHYRPWGEGGGTEHYHYFNKEGFVEFLKLSGFEIIEILDEEMKIGREDILTFVAKK